jgi:creatinine amidohydrolase
MHLHLSTWQEIESYLLRSKGILIPTGSTEQHGPNGLIGTDAICPTAIASHAALEADLLVGPTLALGTAQFNLKFPGTISLRPSTLMSVVEDYVLSLASQGFQRFYFINGHGGNLAPLRSAFQEIYTRYSLSVNESAVPRCRLRSWWQYPQTNSLRQSLYAEKEGAHATPSEVAMAQYAFPEHIKDVSLGTWHPVSLEYLRNHADDDHYEASDHRRRHPDGRIGSDPSLANPKDGQRLLETAAKELLLDYQAFLEEE